MYGMLSRDNETVRDRFFRILWIATLIWKLSETPVDEQSEHMEMLLAEAKLTKPDGTPRTTPQKRKASDASSETHTPKKRKASDATTTKETFEKVKIKMKFPTKKSKKK